MRYLTQRSSSGIWYFRYQIPARFRSFFPNGREIKKSLSTRSLNTARLKASKMQQVLWERLELLDKHGFDDRRQVSGSSAIALKLPPLDDTYMSEYLQATKRQTLSKLTTYIQLLERTPNLLRAQKQRIALRKDDSSIPSIDVIESIWQRDASPIQVADEIASLYDFPSNLDTLHCREDKKNICIAMCQFTRDFQQCLDSLNLGGAKFVLKAIQEYESGTSQPLPDDFSIDDCWSSQEPVPEKLDQPIQSEERVEVQIQPSAKSKVVVDIETVIEGYQLEKTNLNKGQKEAKAVLTSCRLVHELLGSPDMSNVSRDDVNRIIPQLKLFPKNARGTANKKHFDGLSAHEIIHKNKDLGLPVRKEDQALRDIERASTLYRWAALHQKIEYNPFEGLSKSKSKTKKGRTPDNIHGDKDKKDPFTVENLKEIFSHPVYTKGKLGRNTRQNIRLSYQYWIMLIVMVTGARPNEICQLRVKDVREIDEVLCFVIQEEDDDQSIKNDSAARYIPIPDVLFKLGFQAYIDSVSSGRMLFPDLTYTESSGYYGKVEDWFDNHFSTPMKLKEQNKSLYSLRHSFIFDYQKRGKNCMALKQLVGHKNGNITDDTYGGRISHRQLKDKIEEYDVSEILKDVLPFELGSY